MKTLNQPMLGTISHGTLRPFDLYDAFRYECNRLDIFNDSWIIDDTILYDDDHEYWHSMDCHEALYEMQGALCGAALPYTYFGSHEGEWSDFGFWIDWVSIDEARRTGELPNSDQVPDDYNGLSIEVNDHGNVAIFQHNDGERTILWDCV